MTVIIGSGLNSPPDDPVGTPLIGYDNLVTANNISSSSAVDGFPIGNVANPATHLVWKSTNINPIEDIQIASPGTINYIAIAGHNLTTQGVTVAVKDFSVSPATILVPAALLPDDRPTIFRFPSGNYGAPGLELNQFAATDFPQIAVIYAGILLVLERGIKVDIAHVPITYGRRTTIVNGMSETGNFLGRIVLSESRQSKAEFFGFTPDFYRNSVDPFLDAAQEVPFFWAWAPGDYPLETGFAWLTEDVQPEVSPDHRRIALTLSMAGIA